MSAYVALADKSLFKVTHSLMVSPDGSVLLGNLFKLTYIFRHKGPIRIGERDGRHSFGKEAYRKVFITEIQYFQFLLL